MGMSCNKNLKMIKLLIYHQKKKSLFELLTKTANVFQLLLLSKLTLSCIETKHIINQVFVAYTSTKLIN